MSFEPTTVGLDVHARSTTACAICGPTGEISTIRLSSDHTQILGWLTGLATPVRVVYEAGPTGFALARTLTGAGLDCVVAAPSKLQRPSGDRIKTDARDALHLARLLRLGEVTPVRVPTPAQEAARDLSRAREDARADLMRARHRLSKLLLRQGLLWEGKNTWSWAHHDWIARQSFTDPALQAAFEAAHEQVLMVRDRRDRLDEAITQQAADPGWAPVVERLRCLRAISTVTAFGLATEIGDWHRFTGSSIGAYVGLVPSEHSSGSRRVLGPITKTGNTHVRRLLVEAAWHHRRPYRQPTREMRARWERAPAAARSRGHAGNHRLHRRWARFDERGKKPSVAVVAIARELAGWCWALAVVQE
ncbi:IS110 family transposase [Nocardiopsis sp. YSL2]|uniref:IS110 family transposase n=1 Tax=Nocardiopsis sp. YSL2 TaxID=2939492 RepID=UPI0026F43F50|nr:IS110 family transposase [Nocardiopsis sp. YSL2]